jgi:hypothetical protein
MRKSVATVVVVFVAEIFGVTAAMAGPGGASADCIAAVEAAQVEWRALSHSSLLRPSQRLRLADGRVLAGSQINYSHVLIARAENSCGAGQFEQAQRFIAEANDLLGPGSRRPMIASPAASNTTSR